MTARRPSGSRRRRLQRIAAALVIICATGLAAVWTAPRASGAVAEWIRTPPVETRTLQLPAEGDLPVTPDTVAAEPGAPDSPSEARAEAAEAASETSPVTMDAGMQFTMLGVTCDVPAGDGDVALLLRTSLDGKTWTAWVETPLEIADEEGIQPIAFTDPLWTGEARYAQVSAAATGSDAPLELSGTELVAIDPTDDADGVAGLTNAVRRVAATVSGLDLVPAASAATDKPTIVTRSEWGANESWRSGSPSYATVKMGFIHHTASGNTYTSDDAAALVRGVYSYHTKSLGWSDIGYNFLVDRYGTIYEGRYGGVTKGVIGAQVLGFNTGSFGVSVMGTFTSVAPPAAAISSLEKLLAWKLSTHGLDPSGTAKLTCGYTEKYTKNSTVTFPVIAGHRDANYTACPGTSLYALLPSIRTEVASRIQAAVTAKLTVSEAVISPNGDDVLDETVLGVKVSTTADWSLKLSGASGGTVASWSGQGTSAAVTWDGADVPDGTYSAELTATSTLGDPSPATATVTVDTTAPKLSSAAAAPDSFSPNGDRQAETAEVTYSPAEACAVRVGIKDETNQVRRWLHGWRSRGTGTYTVVWDGMLSSNGVMSAAPDGEYRFSVERRDDAGNIARLGCRLTVDNTLGFPTATPVTLSPNGDGLRDSTTLGFKLTGAATVTLTVRLGSETIRTIELGSLAKGTHTTIFDGKDSSDEALSSGRPTYTITALSTLGETSVTKSLVVDRYSPRLYATKSKTVKRGKTVKMGFKAYDPYSAKVDVSYRIVNARGKSVGSAHPGWVRSGVALTFKWKPKARGVYTVVYRATDHGSNRERNSARTKITVR